VGQLEGYQLAAWILRVFDGNRDRWGVPADAEIAARVHQDPRDPRPDPILCGSVCGPSLRDASEIEVNASRHLDDVIVEGDLLPATTRDGRMETAAGAGENLVEGAIVAGRDECIVDGRIEAGSRQSGAVESESEHLREGRGDPDRSARGRVHTGQLARRAEAREPLLLSFESIHDPPERAWEVGIADRSLHLDRGAHRSEAIRRHACEPPVVVAGGAVLPPPDEPRDEPEPDDDPEPDEEAELELSVPDPLDVIAAGW
jgi:hypothetical protein